MASDPCNGNEVDLFLLGKTGHGKSSTGNSILGREAFCVSDSSDSETYVVQVGWARRCGRQVKVVDGPGVCETRLDKGSAAKKMCDDMAQGILQCPQGFHALILVLKYGNRFTEEELSTVSMLKSLFGENFVRDYCILIFTHGELFDMNNRRNPKPFSQWCQEQTGALKTVFEECAYKAVLFYNIDETKADSQLEELYSLVDGLKSKGKRYTNEMFAKVAKDREQLIVRENAPQLRETIQAKIDLLIDGVNSVKEATELDAATKERLDLLREDARALEVEISVQDKGTSVLDSLRQVVVNIQESVASQERALVERKDKEASEKALQAAKKQYNQSLDQLRQEQKKRKKRGFWGFISDVGNFLGNLFKF
ncbi:immune-associated nucleotide-binding protein 4 [Aplysia californica]|uniref:Immune-associated nucleotide-binding protein 4 n=1 Tax=Aplysia californica TaxID=6500 RepID=A0ABM0JGB8_APLCA|nr:immune-associated nucleotide-binding protein 4 [Aplysia californica]